MRAICASRAGRGYPGRLRQQGKPRNPKTWHHAPHRTAVDSGCLPRVTSYRDSPGAIPNEHPNAREVFGKAHASGSSRFNCSLICHVMLVKVSIPVSVGSQ